jgi:hypothetical protein
MSLTIDELRTLIQSAKQQLVASAGVWLAAQQETPTLANGRDWLDALAAPDSESLQAALREKGISLLRDDSEEHPINEPEFLLDSHAMVAALPELLRHDLTPVPTPVDKDASRVSQPQQPFSKALVNAVLQYSEQAQNTERRTYRPASHLSNVQFLIQLGRITTLMEQLHQLESCLKVIQPQVDLTSLQLANAMAVSITVNEWRFVKPGVDTVRAYEQRLQLVRDQMANVQQINLPNLTLYAKQISIQASQFAQTLLLFTHSLNTAFSSEQDDRSWFIRMLTSYKPWHGMLHQLAVTLFGHKNVIHSYEGTLEVQPVVLDELNLQLQHNLREPLISLSTQYAALTQSTITELCDGQEKVNNMKNQLNLVASMGFRRLFALHTPTVLLGPYGFFQRIHAFSHVTPEIRSLSWDEESEDAQSSTGLSLG